MKHYVRHFYILFGFIPWIIFGFLSGHSLASLKMSLIIALFSTVLFNYSALQKAYSLAWVTLMFFGLATILIVFVENQWVIKQLGLLVNITLVLLAWGSLLFGRPFTEAYARENVPEPFWQNKRFRMKNTVTALIWGVVFSINLLITILFPREIYEFHVLKMVISIFLGFAFNVFIIEKISIHKT